jgi:hypothetical protein
VLESAVRPPDLLVILAVPLALAGVFVLPEGARRALAFSYADPTPVTAFAANFVHLEAGHLLANLGSYAPVVPLVYLLSALSGKRVRFLVVFATSLLAFPVALSYPNLAISRPGVAVNSSGITMAFVGFLPLALSDLLGVHFEIDSELDLAGALFFVGMGLIAVLSVRTPVTYGIAAAAALTAALFFLSVTDRHDRTCPDVHTAMRAGGYFELATAAFVLFVGLPLSAFPIDPADGAAVVNLYVHLLGYALGFIVPYVTVHVASRLRTSTATGLA